LNGCSLGNTRLQVPDYVESGPQSFHRARRVGWGGVRKLTCPRPHDLHGAMVLHSFLSPGPPHWGLTKGTALFWGWCAGKLGPNGYRNRYAQLGELVHSAVIEQTPEHEVICRSKPTGEKHREGEIATAWQPPRASGCEAATSSWG
jgi:hypothetical protein